jgi:hypothetical protein
MFQIKYGLYILIRDLYHAGFLYDESVFDNSI